MPKGYVGKFVTPKEATQKWRALNPEKVQQANRKPRKRTYDAIKRKNWRENRLTNDSLYKERINRLANERATGVRRWLDAYKIARGCVDCGFKAHHAALHFDHVRGKKLFNVSNAKSIAGAQSEIAKCEVRCANCHAIKTFTFYPCKPDIFQATYDVVEEA